MILRFMAYFRSRLLLALIMGTQLAASGAETSFKAAGRITCEVFSQDALERSWVRDFKFAVDGCHWTVESFNTEESFYALKSYEDGIIHNVGRVPASTNTAMNKYASVVENEDVPRDDTSGISFVWLAYCSACYLNSVADNKFKPIWLLEDLTLRNEGFTMQGFLKREDGGLPREMTYFHDGLIYARMKGTGRITLRAPPPFQDGFTNAIYRALETTNVGAFKIPLKFEFLRFGVPGGSAATLSVRCKITGELKSTVANAVASDFAPKLEGRTYVQDTRFRKSDVPIPVLKYNTTNVQFLKSDDPKLLSERANAIRLREIANPQRPN